MPKSGAWWQGGDQLARELAKLSRGMQGAALRSALRSGGAVLRDAAKKDTPSKRVRRSLKAVLSGRGTQAAVRVGAARKTPGARILHLIENDTRAHLVRPKRKKVLARGRIVFGRQTRHPGTRGRHTFKTLLDTHRTEVERKTASALRQIIAKMQLRMLKKRG